MNDSPADQELESMQIEEEKKQEENERDFGDD